MIQTTRSPVSFCPTTFFYSRCAITVEPPRVKLRHTNNSSPSVISVLRPSIHGVPLPLNRRVSNYMIQTTRSPVSICPTTFYSWCALPLNRRVSNYMIQTTRSPVSICPTTFYSWCALPLNRRMRLSDVQHFLRCVVSGKVSWQHTWCSDATKRLCVLTLSTLTLLLVRLQIMGSKLPVFTRSVLRIRFC
ncbi:Protein O-mannosyl-transferase tmtc3 [Homalodisca vitripennis]|nr:Protein O-mannosyl-transferase tmtc3 [Homalodisca vitripennis]